MISPSSQVANVAGQWHRRCPLLPLGAFMGFKIFADQESLANHDPSAKSLIVMKSTPLAFIIPMNSLESIN
jgi:hypothetical protein